MSTERTETIATERIETIAEDSLFPNKSDVQPPIPASHDLLRQVIVDQGTVENFLYGGYVVSEGIRRVLELIGRPLEGFQRVLDFGCGSARVLRWFQDCSQAAQFSGSDINEEAIEWCRRNMPFGQFTVNGHKPPLDLPDESFDLIYSISVVTHLDEEYQLLWLEELKRITKPGGIVILTIHGEHVPPLHLSANQQVQYREKGHFYQRVNETDGIDGLPDFYQVAYHSREYIERVWSEFFQPLLYMSHGAAYLQDMVVMQKRSSEEVNRNPRRPSYIYLDLPIGVFDLPRIADVVQGDSLTVSGWTFHPDGGPVKLDFWIDGTRVHTCLADNITPGVMLAFPVYVPAVKCGFRESIQISHLEQGPHRLYATPRTNQVPSFSTYFFKE
jgi:SAM-dependent methyltransferase